MKKKRILLGALVATASLVLLTGCVKKSKNTNTDTGTTPVTSTTPVTTTKQGGEINYSLNANQYYISNDQNVIVKSFAKDNQVSTFCFCN